jgi:hypothetical protein
MSPSEEPSYLVAAAVNLGAVLLVGFPAAAITAAGASSLANLAGIAVPTAVAASDGLLAFAVALFVGREAALVRLHGFGALRRSTSGWNVLRHAVLAVPAVAAVVHLTRLVVAGGTTAGEGGTVGGVWPAVVLGVVVLAGIAVVARAVADGYRSQVVE